jgi:hypothetical protein
VNNVSKRWRLLFHRQSHRFKALPLAPKTISLNKITQNSGLSPHAVLYSGFIMLDKRKKSLSKAGGQRYLAIKGHARPCLILLYH